MSDPFIVSEGWLEVAAPVPPVYQCRFDVQAYHDDCFARLGIFLPPQVANAVPKRRAEFLAGRHVAKVALAALGRTGVDIPSTPQRAPQWPGGLRGSITHTSTRALSCIASATDMYALGIDAEHFISSKLLEEIHGTIVNFAEMRLLALLPMAIEHAFTLAFSAKESLYKAINPHVGRFIDFLEVELFDVDAQRQTFQLRLLLDLAPEWHCGTVFDGSYRYFAEGILTIVALPSKVSTVPLASVCVSMLPAAS